VIRGYLKRTCLERVNKSGKRIDLRLVAMQTEWRKNDSFSNSDLLHPALLKRKKDTIEDILEKKLFKQGIVVESELQCKFGKTLHPRALFFKGGTEIAGWQRIDFWWIPNMSLEKLAIPLFDWWNHTPDSFPLFPSPRGLMYQDRQDKGGEAEGKLGRKSLCANGLIGKMASKVWNGQNNASLCRILFVTGSFGALHRVVRAPSREIQFVKSGCGSDVSKNLLKEKCYFDGFRGNCRFRTLTASDLSLQHDKGPGSKLLLFSRLLLSKCVNL